MKNLMEKVTSPFKTFFGKVLGLALITTFLMPFLAYAQDTVSNSDFLQFLLESIGGLSGLSTLGIVYLVVQAIVMFMKTPLFGSIFSKFSGAGKITTVMVLTVAGGVIGLMYKDGLSFGAAILHSSTLAAFSVLFNQIYKQYIEKKN